MYHTVNERSDVKLKSGNKKFKLLENMARTILI